MLYDDDIQSINMRLGFILAFLLQGHYGILMAYLAISYILIDSVDSSAIIKRARRSLPNPKPEECVHRCAVR